MNRRDFLAPSAASATLAARSSIPGMKSADPLIGALASQLGVSDAQAGGGVG